MFGSSGTRTADPAQAHTLVSRMTEIAGDIHFSGELIVEGKVSGNIYAEDESKAVIRIAESGSVEGEICVPSIVINGRVTGDVRSTNHIELAAKAVVDGNVYYNLIEMVMGSAVNGKLLHISSHERESDRTADKSGERGYGRDETGETELASSPGAREQEHSA